MTCVNTASSIRFSIGRFTEEYEHTESRRTENHRLSWSGTCGCQLDVKTYWTCLESKGSRKDQRWILHWKCSIGNCLQIAELASAKSFCCGKIERKKFFSATKRFIQEKIQWKWLSLVIVFWVNYLSHCVLLLSMNECYSVATNLPFVFSEWKSTFIFPWPETLRSG